MYTRPWQDFTWHNWQNMKSLRSSALGDPAEEHWFAACLATVEGKPSLGEQKSSAQNGRWTRWTFCRKECRFGSKLQQLLHQLTCSQDLRMLAYKHPALSWLSIFLSIFFSASWHPRLTVYRKKMEVCSLLPLAISLVFSILGDSTGVFIFHPCCRVPSVWVATKI